MDEETEDELPPLTFSIPVDYITDTKYLPWVISEFSLHKFLLKKYVFNEKKFQEIYSLAIKVGKERCERCIENISNEEVIHMILKDKDTFCIHSILLDEETKNILPNILLSIFPVSFAILYVSDTIIVLHPWTWRHFVVCNPVSPFVYSYESNDIIEYLYQNYSGLCIRLHHYSY